MIWEYVRPRLAQMVGVAFSLVSGVALFPESVSGQVGEENPPRPAPGAPVATGVDLSHPVFQSGRRIMVAERLRDGETIRLDGRMDEPVWERAVPAADFIMQDPIFGGTPTEPTEVRIAFDRDNLYMGVINFDSEPDRLMGNTMKRDEFLSADDRFMWTIDTFLDQQSGYFFEMNPSGLMADAVMGPGGSNNRSWDGIWDARVVQSEIGWVIEIVIPFRTLNFDPDAPAWGINFQRTVRRKAEETLWTSHERNQGLRAMATAGLLAGIRDVSQGVGLDVVPYLSASSFVAPGRVPATDRENKQDAGVDIFYNLTPNLRANLTVNTDFAETDVDQRQVNLTRFPLQFPEKRGFFLEGGTFFDFSGIAAVQPFFSRAIGLDETGTPQRIEGGAKLTGQAGANDIGALYVRTAGSNSIVGEDFGVLRMRRRFLAQSYVGGIYTWRHGREQEADDGHTAGLDLRLATTRFRGNNNLQFSTYLLGTSARTEGTTGDNLAYGARLAYPNDRWSGSMDFQEVQENHAPAIGFVRRRGFRSWSPSLSFAPRPAGHPVIRQLTFGGSLALFTDMENRTLTREVDLTLLQVNTHSGDGLTLSARPTYERLQRDFQISDGIVLPGGEEYSFTRFQASLNTASRRILALQTRYSFGDFFSGSRQEATVQLGVRPMPGVTLNAAGEFNWVNLPEGDFETRLYRFVADTQFNPRMYVVNNFQYDSVSGGMGWQFRFRWIVQPGNSIHIVYQHNWVESPELGDTTGFRTLDSRAATKINYTWRL